MLADLAAEMERTGWRVVEASTGEGAIHELRNGQHIDLLVTDIRLAGYLNGWDVAEAGREINPSLPVIYASGNAVDPMRMVKDAVFLSKPYPVTKVAKIANDLIVAQRAMGDPR